MYNFIHLVERPAAREPSLWKVVIMKRECPEWAAKIGGEVRLLTDETSCEPPSIASLLRQIDESELAMRSKGIDQLDPWRSHK